MPELSGTATGMVISEWRLTPVTPTRSNILSSSSPLPPKLTTKKPETLKFPTTRDKRMEDSTKSPPTHPITKGQSTGSRLLLLLLLLLLLYRRYGSVWVSAQQAAQDTGHSKQSYSRRWWQNRQPREVMMPLFSTHTIPEERTGAKILLYL